MTTTAEASALTPKQRQVLGLMREGKTVPEIAKRMKISNAGVRSHVVKIRHLPEGPKLLAEARSSSSNGDAPESDPVAPPFTVGDGNGSVAEAILGADDAVRSSLRAALKVGHERIEAIDTEVAEMTERASQLKQERDMLAARGEVYQHALDDLA